jgi:hypothetical protein
MHRGRLRLLAWAVGVVIAAVVTGCGEEAVIPPIGERWTPQSSASDLIVDDGATVEVTGQVIAPPGEAGRSSGTTGPAAWRDPLTSEASSTDLRRIARGHIDGRRP